MSKLIGMCDSFETEMSYNDIVEFSFEGLMDSPFTASSFGKYIKENNIQRCFIHLKKGKEFQPDFGWYNLLCYVVYFLKDNKLFKEFDDDPDDNCQKNNYNFYGVEPRFFIYLKAKESFKIKGSSSKIILDEDDILVIAENP